MLGTIPFYDNFIALDIYKITFYGNYERTRLGILLWCLEETASKCREKRRNASSERADKKVIKSLGKIILRLKGRRSFSLDRRDKMDGREAGKRYGLYINNLEKMLYILRSLERHAPGVQEVLDAISGQMLWPCDAVML